MPARRNPRERGSAGCLLEPAGDLRLHRRRVTVVSPVDGEERRGRCRAWPS